MLSIEKSISEPAWDSTKGYEWKLPFEIVEIPSSDGATQNVIHLSSAAGTLQPLVVSLHTWSGDYLQADPLAEIVRKLGWNYLRPDFRGPARHVDACLSKLVVEDIDRAIEFAIASGSADPTKIIVIGVSGGGYTALGYALRSRRSLLAVQAWAPISDLAQWHQESLERGNKYHDDIEACTGSVGGLDSSKARVRSPLHWEVSRQLPQSLKIFAGIDDGYTGSVPVGHSVSMFNKLARHIGKTEAIVDDETAAALARRKATPTGAKLQTRDLLFERVLPGLDLVIFAGGHELLPQAAIESAAAAVRSLEVIAVD